MMSLPDEVVLSPSILDTDLYKLTMQQAVLHHFPDARVRYKFDNRSKSTQFNRKCLELFQANTELISDLKLTANERDWLKQKCPYLKEEYLDFLSSLQLNPSEQVSTKFIPSELDDNIGQIEISVQGRWSETILYEVPLMAALSDAYFRTMDTDWEYDGQEELAYQKGIKLFEEGVLLSEFGTRRRRSLKTQKLVIEGLIRANETLRGDKKSTGELKGTSNVHLARLYNLTPIGTIAHEWTMGVAAVKGYDAPNMTALSLWEAVYPPEPTNALHIALTDTFTSHVFFEELKEHPEFARRWRGIRQDSGDPIAFANCAAKTYGDIGVGVHEKVIIYSDGLDLERSLRIRKDTEHLGFLASFGVGTYLTNDFKSVTTGQKSKALNIVIKLAEINGKPCVKLSDDPGKNTGDADTVSFVKNLYGLI
ncbi:Quinolinate phosphoribosyl transferase [Cantharellus anzutake]|uniref:Quinolinate phosphoribosyl transferase n=1 Tax=Cantharellus anzutake TaxID=1750568 RepID=UPI001907B0D7|nr:Quinolinate phosphoribosyl transferase [Cantharellus anzutake]KAF8339683.1 Quinolinate phosphoribosyl transferase [Cantharellus anzutake]